MPSETPPARITDGNGPHRLLGTDALSVRRMSAAEQTQWFEQRAARGSRALFDAALASGSAAPPELEDSLVEGSPKGDVQAALDFLSRPGGLPPEEDDRMP